MTTIEDATVIVAHPDDEILWFASALPRAAQVIIAFQDYARRPGLGARRAAAMAALPFPVDALALAEAGTFDAVNWSDPILTDHGLAMNAPGQLGAVIDAYAANFRALTKALSARLNPGSRVFTHNPWGEYGHADHVQLYRVLEHLQPRIGFQMWVSGFVSRRTSALARRYAATPGPILRARPDPDLADQVMRTYQSHDCWTWKEDWVWPMEEVFLPAPLQLIENGEAPPVPDTAPLLHIPAPEVGPDNLVYFR
ncbi:MAG: hypothetical protein GKR99_02715 [Rhodobacteraceae bacterium]|nr:hypothetical protein [Paracoccaceae bacterium]